MHDLSEMYFETEHYNSLFKVKTYMDSTKVFFEKYRSIFEEMNDDIEKEAVNLPEIYDAPVEKKEIEEVKKSVFFKRTEEGIKKPDRKPLTKDMQKIIDKVADEFLEETKRCVSRKRGRLPKGKDALDLRIYVVMYIFPGIIETGRQFAYELAETIGQRWPNIIDGNKLGCADYATIDAGFKRKLCCITTAVCDTLNKPDDCEELTTLRAFRDGYMMQSEEGRRMVEEYYQTAPGIVMRIDMTGDKKEETYKDIYMTYIRPCLDMIEENRFEDCMLHYKSMVEALS